MAIVIYSRAGDFIMGLCVTLIVPIVHAALIFWYLTPLEMKQMVYFKAMPSWLWR